MDSTCQKDDVLFMTHGTLSAYLRSKFVHPNQMFWIRRCSNKEDNWSFTWDKVGSFPFFPGNLDGSLFILWSRLFDKLDNHVMLSIPGTENTPQKTSKQTASNSQTTNILKQTNIQIDNQAMNLFARLQDKTRG